MSGDQETDFPQVEDPETLGGLYSGLSAPRTEHRCEIDECPCDRRAWHPVVIVHLILRQEAGVYTKTISRATNPRRGSDLDE
jgi:hypothetical protein